MSEITIYHGSPTIIQHPDPAKSKPYNDYGPGFYCTRHLELAKEWACTEGIDGYANTYTLTLDGLSVLNLLSEDYHILHWLALLVNYRRIRLSTPMMKNGARWLKDHFLTDLDSYDIVIGYRADDSYFSLARAFVNNEISLKQLSYAMKLGELGEQIVLISQKAFDRISFKDYLVADNTVYYVRRKHRDETARAAFRAELDKEDLDGIFIRDLMRMEVTDDALRL